MKSIEALLHKIMQAYELPGMAVGIMEGGEVTYQQHFGVSNISTGTGLTHESVFQLGSLSKVFVATAIMQLAEQGKIALDEKLVTYLPYLKTTDARYNRITIRQILSHTSGIPDVRNFEWNKPQYDDGAARRYIDTLEHLPLLDEPGVLYHYSNRAYNVLADVIHVCSGMLFETYMRRHFFEPLEMPHSSFIVTDVPERLLVSPHTLAKNFVSKVRKVYPYNRIHAPSSTLYSNVPDMMHWMKANLDNGVWKGKALLQEDNYRRLMQPEVETEQDTYMCLAWKLVKRDGYTMAVSLGGEPGFRAFMILLPEKKTGVFVCINSDNFSAEQVAIPVLLMKLGYEVDPPKTPIHLPLGRTLMQSGFDAAVQAYHYLKKEAPGAYDFQDTHLIALGFKLLYRARKCHDAQKIFRLCVMDYPDSWEAWYGLGESQSWADEAEGAISSYQRALELNPSYDKAVQALRKLMEFKNA